MSDEKKIFIDEDWKSQVEKEKQAAAHGTGEPPTSVGGVESQTPPTNVEGSPDPDDPPMPPASIGMLMSSLATEALLSLGQFPHPVTGETKLRRNQAQYLIDTLAMLQEKTAGNLTSDEAIALDDILHQLRMAFVAVK
ncbi:DUF1844 domain-containing protein [Botrimarina mediterranea]|uniref:DUF1844 domain-containing protein n=1 Tax=Botrimarina mediterranea TaxID=2528022 RepID=A0A518K4C4_9BACT|nr:DUF1844 domain-containing protein [Botrimarina mediterranea]QDV72646.1 hypothetical protein Spa11_08270 [Botrimarina mediterranea]QDV77218.1 hypothetical protein K2D_08080 [Planctomycetes bacterium K2D]